MLETGFEIKKGQSGACEPGVCDNRTAFVKAKENWFKDIKNMGKDGKPLDCAFELTGIEGSIQEAKNIWWDSMKDVGKEEKWTAGSFKTKQPNLDIRHGGNFSGGRVAGSKVMTLSPWGDFKKFLYEGF